MARLWPTFVATATKHSIPPAVMPYVCTGPASYLILEGQSLLASESNTAMCHPACSSPPYHSPIISDRMNPSQDLQ